MIAPTRAALQKMMDICVSYCDKFCLTFNAKKSKVMLFGRSCNNPVLPLKISGVSLDFVDEWKYLGTTITGGRHLSFTARPDISSFCRATNAVLSVLKGAHEHTLLSLLYSNCVPVLTYACSVKQYSASDMSDCNVAFNNALRKIFGFKDWRSIRDLREIFGFGSLHVIFKKAQDRFLENCRSHHNPIVKAIAELS